jgi:hypothetical protein
VPFVLGLSQGVFRLVRAADDSGWLVTPPPIVPATTGAAAVQIVRGDPSRRAMRLDDFEQRVRTLAAPPK